MRASLEKAFEAASRLPAGDQDELASAIMEEIAAESDGTGCSISRRRPWKSLRRKR